MSTLMLERKKKLFGTRPKITSWVKKLLCRHEWINVCEGNPDCTGCFFRRCKKCPHYNAKYKNLIEENKQLRGLLKECKASVKLNSDITRGLEGKNSSNYQNLLSILSRINATLGESEEQ